MYKLFRLMCLVAITFLIGIGTSHAAALVSKQQAAKIARSQFQGRVLVVEETKDQNKPVYRVKVLDRKGGMHTIIINPKTGSIISAH